MIDLVCRIQDAEGRGPYRPGFYQYWSEREYGPLPFYVEFPDAISKCKELVSKKGGMAGCGFRNLDQAKRWFSPNEVLTLARYGYSLVWIVPEEIICKSHNQLVFWCSKKLNEVVIKTGWEKPSGEFNAEA